MELHLPSQPRAARLGRRWVLERLPAGTDVHAVQVIELLVSEVVTNAVKYGRAPEGLRLVMEREHRAITVAVSDANPTPPHVVDPPPTTAGGRGVLLVDRLADAWGVTHDAGVKTVWFRVALDTARR
ncbi:ATP-binding protein [Cellulomonas septica]|uniref:ATP-binding protein n=1 Tax=Cellulomonas septica TaxID=285080 RepID=A0ABX1JW58_9CELL|nr:ATP-binding protein [Cellulomonas septica]NKY38071.1 ATP-binding protein [Cellulomonas septica]